MTDKDELREHSFDGIQEYDNDLPRWWVVLFWITIVWGVGYVGYFHFYLPSPEERLASSLKDREQQMASRQSAKPVVSAEEERARLIALTSDQKMKTIGAQVYGTSCAPCHGAEGQGLVGPNLSDNYWIHGGAPENIKHTVLEGVPAKGMIAWKTLLTEEQVNAVVVFVMNLHGTNPPNPKAAEGPEYKPQ